MSTTSAGQFIRDAVEISGNERLRIKLSTAIDTNDAHAIDIKYHSKCYVNNVTSVLRRSRSTSDRDNSDMAAKIEFIDIIESTLMPVFHLRIFLREANFSFVFGFSTGTMWN